MSITYVTNKNTGVKYAYETKSVWDSAEKKTTTQRKYLGRVDPITGEIIPTSGVRGKKKNSEDSMHNPAVKNLDFKLLYEEVSAERDELTLELAEARRRISALDKQLKQADATLERCEKAIRRFRDGSTSRSEVD